MDIICKPKLNVIFWRNEPTEEWTCENLDTVINAYQDVPYTEIKYLWPVKRENTEDVLYHVFECEKCGESILAVDANHGYKFCPHCGRAIWED